VFIECTATDLTKAKTVLNTVCAMFAEYCTTAYEIEPVQVVDQFGHTSGEHTPHLPPSPHSIC
jgi:phenylalanyl-tRNA synthetase beta chain